MGYIGECLDGTYPLKYERGSIGDDVERMSPVSNDSGSVHADL